MSENMGASTSRKPKGLLGLDRDKFTFTSLYYIEILSPILCSQIASIYILLLGAYETERQNV
jgi:hypothetical protein